VKMWNKTNTDHTAGWC